LLFIDNDERLVFLEFPELQQFGVLWNNWRGHKTAAEISQVGDSLHIAAVNYSIETSAIPLKW